MKKLLSVALASVIAIGALGSSMQSAEAGKRERRIAAGIALGVIGAAIAINEHKKARKERRHRYYSRHYPRHRYYRDDYYDRRYDRYRPVYVERRHVRRHVRRSHRRLHMSHSHVNWCYNRYRSYREWDNSFQPYHGPRRACYSPYN